VNEVGAEAHCASAFGAAAVPLLSLVGADSAFGPEDIRLMGSAFEDALHSLGLVDRDDPATLLVAKEIVRLAKAGERDPIRLRDMALKAIRT
jgi:hypothetical protein